MLVPATPTETLRVCEGEIVNQSVHRHQSGPVRKEGRENKEGMREGEYLWNDDYNEKTWKKMSSVLMFFF